MKAFLRDTPDWLMLSWDAQALFWALLRKADRQGRIHLGRRGKLAVPVVVGHPGAWDRIGPALEELLSDTCLAMDGDDTVLFRNYVVAQETPVTATARKQAQREREKVTPRPTPSRDVTRGHAPSQDVTPALPCRAEPAVPCLLKDLRAAAAAPPDPGEQPNPSQAVTAGPPESQPLTPSPAPSPHVTPSHDTSRGDTARPTKSRQADPRHAPLLKRLCEAFEAIRGAAFPVDGHQAKALASLLAKGTDAEILECWSRALGSDEYPRVRTLAELARNWTHFTGVGPPKSSRPAPPPVRDTYGLDVGRGAEPEGPRFGTCEACATDEAQGSTQHGHFFCRECWSECWDSVPDLRVPPAELEAHVLAFLARKRPAVPEPFEKVSPPRLEAVPPPKPMRKSKLGGDPFAGLPAPTRKRKAVHA